MTDQQTLPAINPDQIPTTIQAWVDDGEATGRITIDDRIFSVVPDLAFGVMALLMEIQRLNEELAKADGTDVPTAPNGLRYGLDPDVVPEPENLVICGVRYDRDLFRKLGFWPIGSRFEVIHREHGVVALRILPGPVEIVGVAT